MGVIALSAVAIAIGLFACMVIMRDGRARRDAWARAADFVDRMPAAPPFTAVPYAHAIVVEDRTDELAAYAASYDADDPDLAAEDLAALEPDDIAIELEIDLDDLMPPVRARGTRPPAPSYSMALDVVLAELAAEPDAVETVIIDPTLLDAPMPIVAAPTTYVPPVPLVKLPRTITQVFGSRSIASRRS